LDKAFFVNAVQRENAPSHEGRHGGCSEERGAGELHFLCRKVLILSVHCSNSHEKNQSIKEKSLCSLGDS
jgi:hypothetical protein